MIGLRKLLIQKEDLFAQTAAGAGEDTGFDPAVIAAPALLDAEALIALFRIDEAPPEA